MPTFLTPEPITIEVRNATGEIVVDLSEVTTAEVEVTASGGHPFGFVDEMFRSFRGRKPWDMDSIRRQFSFSGSPGPAGPGAGPGDAGDTGFPGGYDTPQEDPVDQVRIDLKSSPDRADTLIVDTDPARTGWASGFTVRISAPTGSGVRIQSQSADVKVTGAGDKVEIRTASGDVDIDQVNGQALVHSASGDVRLREAGSSCDVKTASGDIVVEQVADDALLHTTSGDVRVGAAAGNVSARSVSGDVQLTDLVTGRTEVNTVSGDVEIGVHAGSVASVELVTMAGETDTDFPVTDEAPTADAPVLHLKVTTKSGDITLRRAIRV